MITRLFNALLLTIMFFVLLITEVCCLWVLRVALNWWLDIDYVEKIKRWAKGGKSSEENQADKESM